jgi:hypothetical protein
MKKRLGLMLAALVAVVGVVSTFTTTPVSANRNKPDTDWNDHEWQSWRNDKWREYKFVQTGLFPSTQPTAVGDRYVLTEDVYDQWGNIIGKDSVTCTATRLPSDGAEFLCNGSVTIDNKGDIQVQGMWKQGETYFTLSVTGGDGKFKFAHGIAKVWTTSDTTRKVVFDFN